MSKTLVPPDAVGTRRGRCRGQQVEFVGENQRGARGEVDVEGWIEDVHQSAREIDEVCVGLLPGRGLLDLSGPVQISADLCVGGQGVEVSGPRAIGFLIRGSIPAAFGDHVAARQGQLVTGTELMGQQGLGSVPKKPRSHILEIRSRIIANRPCPWSS